jgi:hypothetical protein
VLVAKLEKHVSELRCISMSSPCVSCDTEGDCRVPESLLVLQEKPAQVTKTLRHLHL